MIDRNQALGRLKQLADRITTLLNGLAGITPKNPEAFSEAASLIIAAQSLLTHIYSDSSPYLKQLLQISLWSYADSAVPNRLEMQTVLNTLENVRDEIEQGLLGSIAAGIQAEIFDEFIDHADAYLDDNRKNEAGVIAGVTFEDTIRKLCTKDSIEEKNKKLDDLISELSKAKVLNSLEAKRARVGAHLRTKATHAQWDEFDLGAVKEVIEFLRNTLLPRLAS